MRSEDSQFLCFIPNKSPYQRLSQWMLDISGDRGVLKDIIREGAGELVTPDASVLGTACGPGAICPLEAGDMRRLVVTRAASLSLQFTLGERGGYVLKNIYI